MQEIWDAYDKNGNLLGYDLVRGEEIPNGVYHLVCEALVRHVDGTFLLMERSNQKEKFSGFYEATAGGSALKGEDKIACLKREVKEETGIEVKVYEQVAYGVYDKPHCLFYSFLVTVDCPKDSVTMQEGETVGYKWVTENEFIEYVNSEGVIPTQKRRFLEYFKKCGYVK